MQFNEFFFFVFCLSMKNQKSSFLARSDRKQKLATYFYFKSHVNVIEWAYQFHGSKKSFVIEL